MPNFSNGLTTIKILIWKGFLALTLNYLWERMGRCTVTKGQRRIGRTIRKLGNSVELSSKEGEAKLAEQKYKQKAQAAQGFSCDSPIKNLRDPANWKKEPIEK